jgi:hypothetical protein
MDSVRLLREAKGDAKIHTRLRHSFINYRMAKIKNANEVALEAGFDSARAKCASARTKIDTMKAGGFMAGFRRVIVGGLRYKGGGVGRTPRQHRRELPRVLSCPSGYRL